MQYLTDNQVSDLMKRFPSFELSYELKHHNKVSSNYDVCLAIPYGRKAFLWFTHDQGEDVCFLMETDRDKKINKIKKLKQNIPVELCLGTLFYGCLYEMTNKIDDYPHVFVIEDLIYWKGISFSKQTFSEKLGFIQHIYDKFQTTLFSLIVPVALPVMWPIESDFLTTPDEWKSRISYVVHHFQYRSLDSIVPYLNNIILRNEQVALHRPKPCEIMEKIEKEKETIHQMFIPPRLPFFTYTKPQYKQSSVFECKADLQNDIYHIYAYGTLSQQSDSLKTKRVYCGVAYIPNCEISAYMNGLFRNIKENRNLDLMEESDDEDEFLDQRIDKFVDIHKTLYFKCQFQPKFKKWIPYQQLTVPKGKHVPLTSITVL